MRHKVVHMPMLSFEVLPDPFVVQKIPATQFLCEDIDEPLRKGAAVAMRTIPGAEPEEPAGGLEDYQWKVPPTRPAIRDGCPAVARCRIDRD